MAVDNRYKRASAMHFLVPGMHGAHTDASAGVDDEERWAVTWMYNGIAIGAMGAVESASYYYYSLLSGGDRL